MFFELYFHKFLENYRQQSILDVLARTYGIVPTYIAVTFNKVVCK